MATRDDPLACLNRPQQKQGTTVLGNLAYSAFNKPTHLDSSGNTVDFT